MKKEKKYKKKEEDEEDNMKDKKVIFMGTPLFACPVLEALIENTNVVAVITQPDKEVGRKRLLTPSPIKEIAIKNNIKVYTPIKIKDEIEKINSIDADIIVTCAYGQIIPEEILYHPKYHTINVHASLLPNYRGGAPIQRAIMNGDDKTGITIMFTDKGMDSGDIITSKSIPIDINDNIETLSKKLSNLGAALLIDTLPSIFNNTCKRIKQSNEQCSFSPIIKREDEKINFNDKAINIYNKIRALSNIGAYASIDDLNIKIFSCSIGDKSTKEVGTITIDKDIKVSTIDNDIIIKELQIPGKKRMSSKDYLNGNLKELKGKKFN